MTIRQDKVSTVLRRAVSEVLQRRLADPRIRGLVSVTRIDVSPDLSEAFVYVSVLPAQFERRTMHGLRHAAGRVHVLVRDMVRIRSVPRFVFRLDETLKRQNEVLEAIRDGMAREESPT